MPLFRCTNCNHEWDGEHWETSCSWCIDRGYTGTGYVTATDKELMEFIASGKASNVIGEYFDKLKKEHERQIQESNSV